MDHLHQRLQYPGILDEQVLEHCYAAPTEMFNYIICSSTFVYPLFFHKWWWTNKWLWSLFWTPVRECFIYSMITSIMKYKIILVTPVFPSSKPIIPFLLWQCFTINGIRPFLNILIKALNYVYSFCHPLILITSVTTRK